MPGLVTERVEERVHHQVPVARGQAGALRPGPGHTQGALVRGHRALAPPGGTRGEHDVADVARPHRRGPPPHLGRGHRVRPPLERVPVAGHPHHQVEPVQHALVRVLGRGAHQRAEPVHAEEAIGHEQRPNPAARDHVQRLLAGEPRAHRDQHPACGQRAQRRQQPVAVVRAPHRYPVPGRQAPLDQRGRHRRHPVAQLAVAEPDTAGPRVSQRLRVAELPCRPRHGPRDRQVHRRPPRIASPHRRPPRIASPTGDPPSKQVLGRFTLRTRGTAG